MAASAQSWRLGGVPGASPADTSYAMVAGERAHNGFGPRAAGKQTEAVNGLPVLHLTLPKSGRRELCQNIDHESC